MAKSYHDLVESRLEKSAILDQAIADFTEAIRLASDFTLAYRNGGRAYGESRKYDLAVSGFSRVISCNTRDPELHNLRGYAFFVCNWMKLL